jgi:beta-N-acetylhexosaminidase
MNKVIPELNTLKLAVPKLKVPKLKVPKLKVPKKTMNLALIFIALLPLSACQIKAIDNNMTNKINNRSNDNRMALSGITFSDLEKKIAQKMSLDIRYFCPDIDGKQSVKTSLHCRQSTTVLAPELAKMITETNIGGIVLFAENVVETEQIVRLTSAIQQAAVKSSLAKPIIISVDQEGGRVARFTKMTGFSGNMAIGASYDQHGTHFAHQVNSTIAKELNVLGINNNYAPVIDVNTNAENPVINTRSFGENPVKVAELGLVALNAIQQAGVMGTLKHFPGHGDTHVDSHLGLPRVDHDLATIERVDLAPFSWAIKHSKPAMIMTAHIQYPALDSSTFTSKAGEQLIRPATMSKKILTDLLRNKMAFDGIIATDALDMAGVTHFFTPVEATVETFIAGADLAVMPFKVRTPSDIEDFKQFIKDVSAEIIKRVQLGQLTFDDIEQSVARLTKYRSEYIKLPEISVEQQIVKAINVIAKDEHLAIEQALADAAVTLLKNNALTSLDPLIPLKQKVFNNVHLIVANPQELLALEASIQALSQQGVITINNLTSYVAETDKAVTDQVDKQNITDADIVIATLDVKMASLVDLGGMDDALVSYGSAQEKQQKRTYEALLQQQLAHSQQQKVPSILIAKGSPYLLSDYSKFVDSVLLNFDDRIYADESSREGKKQIEMVSPGINASIQVIFNQQLAKGVLPVSL